MNVAAERYHEQELDFVGRLLAVPLVARLLSRASRLYEKVKNRSVFISVPMTAVETTIRKTVLVCRALLMPVLSRPLLYVEAMACRVFDNLQQRLAEVFFRTDEIVAHVVILVAQLMLCAMTKMTILCGWIIAAVALLIRLTAYSTAIVRLLQAGFRSALDAADHYIDALIVDYEARHDPSHNGGDVLPLSGRIRTVLRKLRTLTELIFWHRAKFLLDAQLMKWSVVFNNLHYQNSSDVFPQTLYDLTLGAVEHAFLVLLFVADRGEFIFRRTYRHVFGFYQFMVTLPELQDDMFQSPTPSNASTVSLEDPALDAVEDLNEE
ncbi:uncharacterized protein LOC119169455 isoform X1 [Rhipicephalus microplus]|uniref:uncharacterized protein LOC119169455 isoform X1 n=1 Tax=Rhipicephalus microplus TaxID=6941 RepID=UPI003F6CAD97